MLTIAAVLVLAGGDVYSQFATAFSQRRGDDAVATPDPAIERAMDLMIEAKRESPKADLDERFTKAIHSPPADFTDYGCVRVEAQQMSNLTFITARMGAATRTRAFLPDGTQVRMPAEFSWNCPYHPEFHHFPSGQFMAYEWQIEQAGGHELIRAVWFRVKGHQAKVTGSLSADTTLDDADPIIRGNTVQLTTIDRPEALRVSESECLFEREITFDCSSLRPRKVREILKQPELRAVDRAVCAAWAAKHPTPLQKRVRRWWPNWEADFENWKIRAGGAVVDVEDVRFRLRHRNGALPVVVGVSKIG